MCYNFPIMPLDYTNIAAIAEEKRALLIHAHCFTPMFYGDHANENSLTHMDALRAYLFLSLHNNKIAQKPTVLLMKLLNASYGDVKNFHAETMSLMTEEDFNRLFQENPEVREYLVIFKDVFNVAENGLREETKETMSNQYDAIKKGMLLYELQQWLKTAEESNQIHIVEQILIPHLKGLKSDALDVTLLEPLWGCSEEMKYDFFNFFKPEINHLSMQNHFSPLTLSLDEQEQPIDYDKWAMLAYCYNNYYHAAEIDEWISESKKTQRAGKIAALGLIIQWFKSPEQLESRLEKIAALNRPNFLTYTLDTFCVPEELGCYRTQIQKMQDASLLFHDLLVPRLWNEAKKLALVRTTSWNSTLFNRGKNSTSTNNGDNSANTKKDSPTNKIKKTQSASTLGSQEVLSQGSLLLRNL